MSKFEYTLASGDQFIVLGPANATQAEADRIFFEQVASGSLVGYASGQTLTSPATQLTKFELSRLDRGTAGIDNSPVLASYNPIADLQLSLGTGSLSTQSILSAIQNLPLPSRMPNLSGVVIENFIDQADIINIKGDGLGPLGVGPLSEFQVQKLMAQLANLVSQRFDVISQDKGIGMFGFSALALEQAGYVKPGTSLRFFAVDPEDFVSVMSSPSVWTGRNGVISLADVLNSQETQIEIQQELMQQSYKDLVASGAIVEPARRSVSVSQGQVFTSTGLQSLSAIRLLGSGAAGISTQIRNISTITSGAVTALTSGTVNLGSIASLNFNSIATGLQSKVTADVGALVLNASKFGTDLTAAWASTGLNSLSGLTSIGNLSNVSLSNISGLLTPGGGIGGSLGQLTTSLNSFGKAGQFATNFANPLGGLSGALGGLSGSLTGSLNSITSQFGSLNVGTLTNQLSGALTGQISGLTSQLSGALTGQISGLLGNLGGLANIGALGSVFGGGGDLVSGTAVAGGFNNTVNRKTVDAAFARIVGSRKIPTPVFEFPSAGSLLARLDITQALNALRPTSAVTRTFGQGVTI